MTERTAIYRIYDAAGQLLYVGMTTDPARRFAEHLASKAWLPADARFIVGAWHKKREDAAAAERAAIDAEQPKYNIRRACGNTPIRNVRITSDIWSAAKSAADARGVTVTDMIRRFLRWYISTPLHTPMDDYLD